MKIRIPIYHWLNDKLGYGEYHYATTKKTIYDVKKAHFKFKEIYGFDICDLAPENGDFFINDDIFDILVVEGIITEEFDDIILEPKVIFELWIKILNKIDDSLDLVSIEDKDYQDNIFYSSDSRKKNLGTPSYGVFIKEKK